MERVEWIVGAFCLALLLGVAGWLCLRKEAAPSLWELPPAPETVVFSADDGKAVRLRLPKRWLCDPSDPALAEPYWECRPKSQLEKVFDHWHRQLEGHAHEAPK